MDAKLLKLNNSMGLSPVQDEFEDDDYTSDEMNCSDEMQSDYDDESRTGNESKRLKSYNNIDVEFRNRTKLATRNNMKSSIKRMPTRKPDPKISNRNAIMARENRRKKKEHMEVLQKTVDETQNENKKLRKMLSIRDNTITKLAQESLYLRSILENKTEIMSLLRSIQGNRTPITSSALSFVADQDFRDNLHINMKSTRSISNSSSGCSPASSMSPVSYIEDDKENDLEISDFNSTTTDNFQWENLLNEPASLKSNNFDPIPDLHEIDDSEILSTNSSNTVKIEHNYFNNPITNNKGAEKCDAVSSAPGVCLHVSQGRVSLEFCASCHLNSQNAWCEEM